MTVDPVPNSEQVFPGPARLGRGAVVNIADDPPAALVNAEQVELTSGVLQNTDLLASVVGKLHNAWANRRPVVVKLGVSPGRLRQPTVENRPPWELGAGFTLLPDRLFFLVWANNWDVRSGKPIWWWSRKAARLGAEPNTRTDVTLPCGMEAWVDGGPRGWLDLPDWIVHAETIQWGGLEPHPPRGVPSFSLAPDQSIAVGHVAGPARVIAPAGSGKTRTLTARINYLVKDCGIEPGMVTAVAYNRRAAEELRERMKVQSVNVRTIHSLGWAILRDARRGVKLLKDAEVRRKVRSLTPRGAAWTPEDPVSAYLEGMSTIRVGLVSPALAESNGENTEGLARVFSRYRVWLKENNLADYDEQICGAVEALLSDPELRRRWQQRCQHLLVDEFQDLTPSYVLLLRLLASPKLNVFAVGDDDQTIYSHAGADPGFLVDYEQYFPSAASHPLQVNYRCPPVVVEAASSLLNRNHRRVGKEIRPAGGRARKRDALRVVEFPFETIVSDTVQIVKQWQDEAELPSVGVLGRVNTVLLPVLAGFAQAGMPYVVRLDPNLLKRPLIAAGLAWMRLVSNPDSMTVNDLRLAARFPNRYIPQRWFDALPTGGTVSMASLKRGNRPGSPEWGYFLEDIRRLSLMDGGSVGLLNHLVDVVGLGGAATDMDSNSEHKTDRAAPSDDVTALSRVATVFTEPASFARNVEGMFGRNADQGVVVTTVHRAKGLEWDRVIVFGAERGLMPHRLSDDIEEERRVAHVAITRCREQVVLVAEQHMASHFVEEMLHPGRAVTQALL